jgi:hypothetical protein
MLLDILTAIAGADYEHSRRLCQAWFAPSCPGRRDPSPVTFSVVAGPFCARLIRSGATSILFVLFPQKLASLSIDEMYPSASLAGDSFVLVGRRVIIAVEPVLDFHPCYWAGEQQTVWHASLVRGLDWSAMIWLNYKTCFLGVREARAPSCSRAPARPMAPKGASVPDARNCSIAKPVVFAPSHCFCRGNWKWPGRGRLVCVTPGGPACR